MKQTICKYPYIPREKDRRFKLTEQDINDIKRLFKQGWNKAQLARQFNVSETLIRYYVKSSTRHSIVRARKAWNNKRANEPKAKARQLRYHYDYRQRRKKDPEYIKWFKCWVRRHKQASTITRQSLLMNK